MKTTVTLVFAGLLLASGRLPTQQTFPLYTGTVPNSQPGAVQETSTTLASGGVRIANVAQPTLTAFLPAAGTAHGTAVKQADSRNNRLGKTPTAGQIRPYANELPVAVQPPPTFLVHAGDDRRHHWLDARVGSQDNA